MAGSTADVPQQGISESVDLWVDEIRRYLLGRLSVSARVEDLERSQSVELAHPPIRRWWTLEGKHYSSLGGPLGRNWARVIARAQRLEQTFNPRLRLEDRPNGVVDWARTIVRGPRQLHSQFVVHSSGAGLNEEERAALYGWAAWITREWAEYARANNMTERLEWPEVHLPQEYDSVDRLRRWAHTARRSRWALLRDVVAESIRPLLESEELNRIPLPADPATLFELLCLIRIARTLAPIPRELRWLNYEMNENTIHFDGVRCSFQQSIGRESVLASSQYRGTLAMAARVFGIRVPDRMDVVFDFHVPRAGFDGIIVEAKSGTQQYGAAVEQLRVYQVARPRRPGTRFVIWGIVENTDGPDATVESVNRLLSEAGLRDDLWIFSSADAIPTVLQTLFADRNALDGSEVYRGNARLTLCVT